MQTIQIDFNVYKALTLKRENEATSYNDVLRKLLNLPAKSKSEDKNLSQGWSAKGVFFPEGTEFRANYKADTYHARVENGEFVMDGKKFESPSQAAMHITKNSVNGWIFWEAKIPGEQTYKLLKSFRGEN